MQKMKETGPRSNPGIERIQSIVGASKVKVKDYLREGQLKGESASRIVAIPSILVREEKPERKQVGKYQKQRIALNTALSYCCCFSR